MLTYQLRKYFPVIEINRIGGAVHAGFPSPGLDFHEGEISLDRELIKNPDYTYLVQAIGDSMIDAFIPPGAWLLVDRSVTPQNMSIVIGIVYGEPTVKYLRKEGVHGWLLPANKKYQPIEIIEEMDFLVWGVVTKIIHDIQPNSYVRFG